MASGQLARRVGVPFRSSNVTSANAVDAQAAYESMMSLWGVTLGGAHLVEHAAGWMHGGLTASFEKLILDAEMLQMMDAYFEPLATGEGELAVDAILEAENDRLRAEASLQHAACLLAVGRLDADEHEAGVLDSGRVRCGLCGDELLQRLGF